MPAMTDPVFFRGERIMTDWIYSTSAWVATLYGYGGDPSEPVGHGETEQQAIDDLKQQLEEREDDR